ncbi:hydroxymethylglutaryl-CoA lyase [Sphingomonas abietis]|uniref:Hydroxymethylglutaryl-CoA lyase n=1 Tax=Sphingomonas abietis TaxID=3012344 RepID=A0ABY7NIL6_9SPHN|nr:hydroxymethylglutaryl-CoA lyase [Sphingomonas abietis]WBO21338.1 hydroxymethylglutaryl-CoA lyase [Sphingomonas abietis]
MAASSTVRIVEVGPRDGLQNEASVVTPSQRIALIEALVSSGLETVEAGSFVSPKWVPQMAGSGDVLRGLPPRPGISYPVLVPNLRGLEDAMAAGAREIALFLAASESFSRKNINCSIDESFERVAPVVQMAKANGIAVRGYVSCVLGCPYEGEVALASVVSVAERLIELGCYEISLGDTIGVGTPGKARAMVECVSGSIPTKNLAIHFHDTYGQALANVLACLETGIAVVDSAAGGLGGCPYAAGASGNLATEDLLYMLDGLGIATGVDLERLLDAVTYIADDLRIAPRSKLFAARRSDRGGDRDRRNGKSEIKLAS